jgi:hypothetical protein
VNASNEHGDVSNPDPIVYVGTHDLPRFVEVAQITPRPLLTLVHACLT